ncbi:hypothetical protein DK26_15115 [Bosea sp. WAO]|uniref:hypothetical protein n=1 Tax=Bosea sp. WAO TaxID=406341 RepID=UPI000748EF36|nr:hypothetical protein [Bosea sp. WAO]KUL94336.1 hypothetical protein DK26_15115 [Bosea sp. WAO]
MTDPVDLAHAIAAVEEVWAEIRSTSYALLGTEEQERERLKFIVASLVPMALDEKELVARAVERFIGNARKNSVSAGREDEEPLAP